MAGITTKSGTLVALTAQTFNFATELGESRPKSAVYINDDASNTHKLVTNGVTLYVKPGERQELTGIENYASLVIGGDAGSVGAYRCVVSTGYIPANVPPVSGPVVTASITDGAVTEAKLEDYETRDVLLAKRCAVVVFDPSADANLRPIGVHSVGPTLPDNTRVTRAYFETITGFTSATNNATLKLGSPDNDDDIKASTLISNAMYSGAATTEGIPTGTVANFGTKFTAAQQLIVTVGAEDLTAGKLELHIEYDVFS